MPRPSFLVLLTLPAFAMIALAQGDRASILGQVTGASGAAVPGAAVTVTNTGAQQRRAVKADDRGGYEVGIVVCRTCGNHEMHSATGQAQLADNSGRVARWRTGER